MNESISLFYKDGSSDKVYNASIEASGSGYVVNFSYGRRGSALTTGTKTASPIDLVGAKKVYEKLVKEKTAKGYKPDGSCININVISQANRDTGIHPQLLNPIEESSLERYFKDSSFCMQQKHDGRRLLVQKMDGKIIGINRKGQEVPLRKELIEELSKYPKDITLDGEDCGDSYWAFDCLKHGSNDITWLSYESRLDGMSNLFESDNLRYLKFSPVFLGNNKMVAYSRLRKENAEGVVFKKLNAPYVAGRPNSEGNQLKFKFVATTTCKVTGQNGTKRSVSLTVRTRYSDDDIDIGNVTIPANFDIPKAGDLVEIRYLYAYKNGGSLYQPVYLGVRDDLQNADTVESLKFKAEGVSDEDGQ